MLQYLNLLEGAIAYGQLLHSESWDIHKAFDSGSKTLMRMAWHRAGVPLHIAQWLAEIDINGVMVKKSKRDMLEYANQEHSHLLQEQ